MKHHLTISLPVMVIINLLHLQIAKYLRPMLIGLILCVSHSRTFSIVNGYAAPLEIYKHFEHHYDAGTGKNRFMSFDFNGMSNATSMKFLRKKFMTHLHFMIILMFERKHSFRNLDY